MDKIEYMGHLNFSKAYHKYVTNWGNLHRFRTVAQIAIPDAKEKYGHYMRDMFDLMAPGGEKENYIIWKEGDYNKEREFQILKERMINIAPGIAIKTMMPENFIRSLIKINILFNDTDLKITIVQWEDVWRGSAVADAPSSIDPAAARGIQAQW